MLPEHSHGITWEGLFALWNSISCEKGLNISFKEIVMIESIKIEGVEPCQGFDWLPTFELRDQIKPKKRTERFDFGKYPTYIPRAPKASLVTLAELFKRNRDREAFAFVVLFATARQLRAKLPDHWRGWNNRYLLQIDACCRKKADSFDDWFFWSDSSKWFFPNGYYSESLLDTVFTLNISTFVELALYNLAFYCDTYRPCYYLVEGVDDVERFKIVSAEVGLEAVCQFGMNNFIQQACESNEETRVKRIKKDIDVCNEDGLHVEGRRIEKKSIAYERSPLARRACLEHYGYKCVICGMDFGDKFGEEFSGLIEVHHLEPLSLSKEEHEIDPIKDLVPLCPNCHRMIHKKRDRPFTLEEMRTIRGIS